MNDTLEWIYPHIHFSLDRPLLVLFSWRIIIIIKLFIFKWNWHNNPLATGCNLSVCSFLWRCFWPPNISPGSDFRARTLTFPRNGNSSGELFSPPPTNWLTMRPFGVYGVEWQGGQLFLALRSDSPTFCDFTRSCVSITHKAQAQLTGSLAFSLSQKNSSLLWKECRNPLLFHIFRWTKHNQHRVA